MGMGLPVFMWRGLSHYLQHWHDNQVVGGLEGITSSNFKGSLKGRYMSGPKWYCRLIYFFILHVYNFDIYYDFRGQNRERRNHKANNSIINLSHHNECSTCTQRKRILWKNIESQFILTIKKEQWPHLDSRVG